MTKIEIIELLKEEERVVKTEMTRLTALGLLINELKEVEEEDKMEAIKDINDARGDLNDALTWIGFARKDIEK
jgi:hypothetical protein